MLLGSTKIRVSRLSFGTAYMGGYGDELPPEQGAALLLAAFRRDVFYWDTADDYGSHPHVACALRQLERGQVVISSKMSSLDKPLEILLAELGTSYLDILFLHDLHGEEAYVRDCLDGLRLWDSYKQKGWLRAIGVSTHSARTAALAAGHSNVEVVMLPLNATGATYDGNLVEDGSIRDMHAAAKQAWKQGKGVIAMKVLGGGTLTARPEEAIAYAKNLPYAHSLVIGMRSEQEIEANVTLIYGT